MVFTFGAWQYLQIFVQTASIEALRRWGNFVSVTYKEASAAQVTISLTGVTATQIPSGTAFRSNENNLIYTTQSDVVVGSEDIEILVICSEGGIVGNLTTDTTLATINPTLGIPEEATVVSTTTEGFNEESIEDYRQRVLLRYIRRAQGGAGIDYFNWATEVDGIVDCFPYVIEEGTVKVFAVKEGSGLARTPTGTVSPNPFPNYTDGQPDDFTGSGQKLAIAQSIETSDSSTMIRDRRPATAKVEIANPAYENYNIAITGVAPTPGEALKTRIKNALIKELDTKKPHVKTVGYTAQDALINSNQLSSIVTGILQEEDSTFTGFTLSYDGNVITERNLGIGALANLQELRINGQVV
jgi:uncharacterized phage protein gp47/JayE